MQYQIQRDRMVQEQLVARGIKDIRVLQAMMKIPRHVFVEEAFAMRAYGDYPLPIGEKQTISQPFMVGCMVETLGIDKSARVLEIGTGSGYQTAVLAEICQKVYSIERVKGLALKAQRLLERLGYHNFQIKTDDGSKGWAEKAPFEAIIVSAAAPEVPVPLCEQLDEGGRLVIPVGREEPQVLQLIRKKNGALFEEQKLSCMFVKLIGEFGWKA
jgi:protein-L-isoaspartate(D-aspartate) O-methyltransferase